MMAFIGAAGSKPDLVTNNVQIRLIDKLTKSDHEASIKPMRVSQR